MGLQVDILNELGMNNLIIQNKKAILTRIAFELI